MRVLFVDIDSLRPDHLGCYGYARPTSPTIDAVAAEGMIFRNCFTSDAPCLPSRMALSTGRLGIHSGVVGLSGATADPFPIGADRAFGVQPDALPWFSALRELGVHVTTITSFPERHAAWNFCAGANEWFNPGLQGYELASDVNRFALPWLRENAQRDNWFLHVNYWDPHTPYRTPPEFGEPFATYDPPPWYSEDIRLKHWQEAGAMTASDPMSWWEADSVRWPRMPDSIASVDDWRGRIDGYDTGVRYVDEHLGELLAVLEEKGVSEETAIVITSDHGENLGELNVYSDHHTADVMTCRVPLIIKWPGVTHPNSESSAFIYQFDFAATSIELLGGEVPLLWDARSFAPATMGRDFEGYDYLVFGQMAWNCQRSVRFDEWLLIRSYHPGWRNLPATMLFNIEADPHETDNRADERQDIVRQGLALLDEWHAFSMSRSHHEVDPLQVVLREGGPGVLKDHLAAYCRALRSRGEEMAAETIEKSWRSAQTCMPPPHVV